MNERSGRLVIQKYREYLIPVLLTSLAFSAGSLVKNAIVGHCLGGDALSAVGLASPILLCMDFIELLFSVGGVTCVTVALGRLDGRRASVLFSLSLAGGTACMALLYLLSLGWLPEWVLRLAHGNEPLAAQAARYIRPLLLAGPFEMFACLAADFISVEGRPRTSAAIVLGSTVLQLVLGYAMITWGHAGISGVSEATLAGNVIACLMVIPFLWRKKGSFRFVLPRGDEWKALGVVLRSGFSMGWIAVCDLLSSTILILLITATIGPDGLSILVVCTNIQMILKIAIGGATDTLLPIAGSLCGEKDYFGIRQIAGFSVKLLAAASIAMTALFLAVPEWAARLFGLHDPALMEHIRPAVRMYVLVLPFFALSSFLQYHYHIIGQMKLSGLLTLLKSLVYLIGFGLLLSAIREDLIWLCFLCAEVFALLTVLLLSLFIRKRKGLGNLLLLPGDASGGEIHDFTVTAGIHAAGELSRHISGLCKTTAADPRLMNHVAVAVEEMTIATAAYAHGNTGKGLIDVSIRLTEDKVYVRFRDNGAAFNPMDYIPPPDSHCATDGILLLRKMADHLHYSRQLGFNTTHLIFSVPDSAPHKQDKPKKPDQPMTAG